MLRILQNTKENHRYANINYSSSTFNSICFMKKPLFHLKKTKHITWCLSFPRESTCQFSFAEEESHHENLQISFLIERKAVFLTMNARIYNYFLKCPYNLFFSMKMKWYLLLERMSLLFYLYSYTWPPTVIGYVEYSILIC